MGVSFQTTIDIKGRTLKVTVEAEAHIYRDLWGADADGNRGEWRTEIEDLELKVFDNRGKDISDKVEKNYSEIWDDLTADAEEYLMRDYESEAI